MVEINPSTPPGAVEHDAGDTRRFDEDVPETELTVVNRGDRMVQVGSHYHFFEANPVLGFDRLAAYGKRLNLAPGNRAFFPPNDPKTVQLIPIGGNHIVRSFYGAVDGPIHAIEPEAALERLEERIHEPLADPPAADDEPSNPPGNPGG